MSIFSGEVQHQLASLLGEFKFNDADGLFERYKSRLPSYLEQRNEAYEKYITSTIQEIENLLNHFNFILADRLYQTIKNNFANKEYYSMVEKYKNRQMLELTLIDIEQKLNAWQFDEARSLYFKISHLFPEEDFERKVLAYRIRYELYRFNFLQADKLIEECDSHIAQSMIEEKAQAIQRYFQNTMPANEEQAIALANQSKNLLIKARAGSGKTRVLACKTAMLINCYKVNPDKILILSFNKKAAVEIGYRIKTTFGIESFENARTFHSLAYQLVRFNGEILFDNQGEFSRPALTTFVQEILRNIWSSEIQTKLYHLFRKELHSLEQSGGLLSDSGYLAFIRNKRDIALSGDRVKSAGEKYIADYLFEHDIPYFYERVEFWSGHNYHPDFTLFQETGQVVIEYWGIDENDSRKSIPKDWSFTWDQYHNEMQEKRKYWEEKRIPLVELSIADTRLGRKRFEEILEERLAIVGIKKGILNQKDMEKKVIRYQKDRMTDLFVQFIQKAKKQRWDIEDLQNKVRTYQTSDEREKLFLALGCQVYSAYQKKLSENNAIDFDDLIIKAANLIRDTQGNCTIDLGLRKERHISMKEIEWILVDEFQDFSGEFHFLIDTIQEINPNVRLVCVGDNWQAINGFAGSDLRFFEQFSTYFQNSNTVSLLTNHRSEKAIVDFGNKVMSGQGKPGLADSNHMGGKVEIISIDDIRIECREDANFEEEKMSDQRFVFYEARENGKKVNDNGFLQAKYLKACYQIIKEPNNWECLTQTNSQRPIIAILSRTNMHYRITLNEFLDKLRSCFTSEDIKAIGDFRQKIKISTAHGYKGLEAEIGIILRVCDGSFPLLHPDNCLFEIIGQTEKNALDEERRLFYVSVTRPSQKLYLLTEKDNPSSFVSTSLCTTG